jgi:nitrogen fixation protein NifX
MKYRIAVGTGDKINITEHFGQCGRFHIFEADQETDEIILIEERDAVFQTQCGGHQEEKIREKIRSLRDCRIVLVKQIGGQSEKLLNLNGITALQYQGTVEEALRKVKSYYKRQIFAREEQTHGQRD